MLAYRTELQNRPPVPEPQVAAMKSQAPTQGQDAYLAALNLPAYQRQVEMANLGYGQELQQRQQRAALEGLMAMQNMSPPAMHGSLLGNLMQ